MSATLADALKISGAQLRRQVRPRVRIVLEFRFRAAYRAPVRLWQGGAWCLPPTANQN